MIVSSRMAQRKHGGRRQSRKPAPDRPDRHRSGRHGKHRPNRKRPETAGFGDSGGSDHGRGGPARLWLYGRHSVAAALVNPRRQIRQLVATPESAETLLEMASTAGRDLPDPEIHDRDALEALLPAGALHQGIAARCEPLPDLALPDLLAEIDPAAPALLVGLDHVTDPQNVGAVLRSAAAFGARGVFLTERHAAPETGALARAASGALDVTPLVRVGNLAKALDALKEAGFWIFGLAGEASERLDQVDLPERCALVLGAEGSGLRRLTRERCDRLVRLPTGGPIDQLNVSNAAAVALYELRRRNL